MGWMRRFEQEWTDEERAEFEANCAAMKAGNLAQATVTASGLSG